MEITKIYLAGEFIETNDTLNIYYPFNGEHFAITCKAGYEELNKAIEAAERVKVELTNMPAFQRSEILLQIKKQLLDMREIFAQTITAESGKPIKNAR
ncbi:MAG: aldehyde dehydrogenase family protein, partial [Omnitrophica WOR_2 bacterium]